MPPPTATSSRRPSSTALVGRGPSTSARSTRPSSVSNATALSRRRIRVTIATTTASRSRGAHSWMPGSRHRSCPRDPLATSWWSRSSSPWLPRISTW